jgi:hypothetical protein
LLSTDFERGDVLYTDSSCLLEDRGVNRIIKLLPGDGRPLFVHTDVHAVKLGMGLLRVYSFDSFINHSCSPNSAARDETADGTFTTMATRDIKSGDEITTDYDTFIYSYAGIPQCQCGSGELCRGFSFGFKHVPRHAQLVMLPRVHPDVVAVWQQEQEQEQQRM